MVRHIALGNGSLLVNIDKWLQTRDIYFPHVGAENHLLGHAHKIGLFANKKLSWLNEDKWKKEVKYKTNTLISDTVARQGEFEIRINDCVHFKKNVFLKKIEVKNNSDLNQDTTLYFYQDFHLYGDGIGDTAAYDPSINAIFHYKKKRYFLLMAMHEKSIKDKDKFGDIHEFNISNSDGSTFRDAEDNKLEGKAIDQGNVESTFSVKLKLKSNSSQILYFWISCGKNYKEVAELNQWVMKKSPKKLFKETELYWKNWLKTNKISLKQLPQKIKDLYFRSLLTIKTQIGKNGAIIAANDSDNQEFNKDTYSYVWPRDGAIVAMALQKAGFVEETKPFFNFCSNVLTEGGFLLHKYNPDGSLGSSWLPYVKEGKAQLPIQEDETALLLVALWNHFQNSDDKKFLKNFYPMIRKIANFLIKYRYADSKLPRESYDLWEERRGILCFTANTVCAGLKCASLIAKELKQFEDFKKFDKSFKEVHSAIEKYFFDKEHNCFLRMINFKNGSDELIKDSTVESSLYSNFYFGGFDVFDDKITSTMNKIKEVLWVKTKVGGFARYKFDKYHAQSENWDKVPGNPWFICTLWFAKYHIKRREFNEALKLINWVADNALESGIFAEQINPYTGESLSVSPLTWSHAEFVETICDLQNERFK